MKKSAITLFLVFIALFSFISCSSSKSNFVKDKRVINKNDLSFPLGDDVSERFYGTVYFKNLIKKDSIYNFPITNHITFSPGSHSGWHNHGGMIVLVTGGRGYYQTEGEKSQILQKGGVLQIPAGVKHWHGATKDSWFSQIVIYDADWKAKDGEDIHEELSQDTYNNLEEEEYRGRNIDSSEFMFGKGEAFPSPNFSGIAYVSDVVPAPNVAGSPSIHNVVFEAGCYNNWHSHEGGQILIATDGIGFHQIEGEEVEVLYPGDVAYCPPNVKHWHGATANSSFAHLAINTNPEKPAVEWYDRFDEKD